MMRPVSLFTGEQINERRIPAHEMRSDEFFYYVVFEDAESKNALVKFSNLSQTALDVKIDDMTTPSKWKIGENGEVLITEGSKRVAYVRAGSIVDYNIITAGAGASGGADVSGLQTQITALNTKISSLEAELLSTDDDETGRVVALESARDALSMRIDALEDTTIPDLDDRIAVLEGIISTMGGSGDIGDLTNLIASVNDLSNWRNVASAELAGLRGDLNGVLAELNGAGGLLNWRNEASASLSSLSGETAYLNSELQAVKDALTGITGGGGNEDRVSEYAGASPITAAAIGSSSAAYVTFTGIPKGEIVLFASLSASQTAVGPAGAAAKSNWTKDGSGSVSYTTAGVNPSINGIWLCSDAARKELDLQNKRFNTISENITTVNSSLDELADRVTALEEGMGAMLLPQAQINDIKAGGFASNNNKAMALDTYFNQDGRKYFFSLNNVSSGWANMPVNGTVSGNIELIRVGNILSCVFTVNRVNSELTYRSYQGYWEISSTTLTWQVPENSDGGWIAVVSGNQLSVGVTTWDSGDQTNGRVTASKSVNVVNVQVKLKAGQTYATDTLIATLPEAYRPAQALSQVVGATGWNQGTVSILANGKVQAKTSAGVLDDGGGDSRYQFTWIAENSDPLHVLSVDSVDFASRISGSLWTNAGTINKTAVYDPASGMVRISAEFKKDIALTDANNPLVPAEYRPQSVQYGLFEWTGTGHDANYCIIRPAGIIEFWEGASRYNSAPAVNGIFSLTYILPKTGGAYIIEKRDFDKPCLYTPTISSGNPNFKFITGEFGIPAGKKITIGYYMLAYSAPARAGSSFSNWNTTNFNLVSSRGETVPAYGYTGLIVVTTKTALAPKTTYNLCTLGHSEGATEYYCFNLNVSD
jgi:hypothetical protein